MVFEKRNIYGVPLVRVGLYMIGHEGKGKRTLLMLFHRKKHLCCSISPSECVHAQGAVLGILLWCVLQARLFPDWQRVVKITSGRAQKPTTTHQLPPSHKHHAQIWHRHGVTQAFHHVLQSFLRLKQKQTLIIEWRSEKRKNWQRVNLYDLYTMHLIGYGKKEGMVDMITRWSVEVDNVIQDNAKLRSTYRVIICNYFLLTIKQDKNQHLTSVFMNSK